jgi:hypothetical protein
MYARPAGSAGYDVIGNDTIGSGNYVVAQFCAIGNADSVDCSRFPQEKQGATQANRIEYI